VRNTFSFTKPFYCAAQSPSELGKGALKSFRDGLAIADRLAKADPGDAGWQHDLGASYGLVGDVWRRAICLRR
jgi:hypothetical protein